MARNTKTDTTGDVEQTTDDVRTEVATGETPLTAAEVLKRWNAGRADTLRERINYWMNYAFWRGAQWVYSPSGFTADAQIVPVSTTIKKRREQATNNRIKPGTHTVVSSSMKVPLTLEVLAQSADDYAHHGAMTSESILRQKGLDEDWEQLKEKWITAAYLGGTSAVVTEWNPEAHVYSPDVMSGDADLQVLSIEDFVIEPGSPVAKRARWWIRKQVLPAEAVQAMYGLDKKPKEDGVEGGPFSESAAKYYSVLSQKRGTQVLTYFERPNSLRPNGAVAVVVDGKFVWGGEKDAKGRVTKPVPWKTLYPFTNRLNLEVGVCILDPEKWTGESPVTDAISPQRQLNAMWSKIHETTHRTAGSKLLIDKRHAELTKKLDDNPEEPIYLTPAEGAAEPHYLTPPQLPAQALQQLQELKEQIDDALGVHAISRGSSPANVESGYGLSILAEQDATPTGRLMKECARVFASAATNILELYSAKVKDKRETVVAEGRGVAHPVKWDGESLAGQTRVIVPPDSVLPRSHAGMLKMATDMLQMKPEWFNSFSQFAQLAFVPGFDDMSKIMDDDIARADYENYRMAENMVMDVFDFDDHAKHIQQHNHFRKSPRYLALPEKTRHLFDAHIQAHMSTQASELGRRKMAAMQDPVLGADPLLGLGAGAQNAMPAPNAGPLDLPPSGAEPQTPQLPTGAM